MEANKKEERSESGLRRQWRKLLRKASFGGIRALLLNFIFHLPGKRLSVKWVLKRQKSRFA
jgi:hypothetical protein